MEAIGIALLIAGTLAAVVCKIWFFVIAFNESPAWSFACFIPFVGLVLILTHWEETALNLAAGAREWSRDGCGRTSHRRTLR